jgi:hypothetical protein
VDAENLWDRTGTTLTTKTAGDKVAAAALPAATTTVAGAVQLADAAAVTAGTAGRVVDAAQLKAVSDAATAADEWTRTGTEITPKTAGDKVFVGGDVKVGGTTAAPNIQLKADGQAAFGGILGLGRAEKLQVAGSLLAYGDNKGFVVVNNGNNGGGVILALSGADGGMEISSQAGPLNFAGASGLHTQMTKTGDFLLGGTLPASPNITLKADGRAVFTGSANINSPNGTKAELSISQTGQEVWYWRSPANSRDLALHQYNGAADTQRLRVVHDTGDFRLGGTLPSAPNLTLRASGNINAKGAVSRIYADNTAAKAGGLVDGDIYRTATGQLMIVFT